MQLSSSSGSSGGIGASIRGSHGLPSAPSDPLKDVASAFGSVIFEPGARPTAVRDSSPTLSPVNIPIEEGEEDEPDSAACDAAAGCSLGGDDGGDFKYGSPVDAGIQPADDAGAESRRGSAPSVPPLSPQATPGGWRNVGQHNTWHNTWRACERSVSSPL